MEQTELSSGQLSTVVAWQWHFELSCQRASESLKPATKTQPVNWQYTGRTEHNMLWSELETAVVGFVGKVSNHTVG